jgi:hypothetical protein
MIKISHEVPLCLLENSKQFNDYQYALVHLLEKDEYYRNHFIKCKNENIPIYLDNSLHELGKAIGGDILMKWIYILEPECVFIPDVWENKTASIVNARAWSNYKTPEGTTKVAVVQAKSFAEALECTHIYKDLGYKKIAYSYGASYYNEIINHPNKDLGKALGRVKVITDLYKKGILTSTDRVHLLGCTVPFEFALYQDIECIESIDTSNPIMTTIDNIKYNPSLTNPKPKSNMNDHIHISAKDIDFDLLNYNLKKFRELFEN